MEQINLKKIKLLDKLKLIPDNKLDGIIDYIEFILSKFNISKKESNTLEGIWENIGFEKINNLEKEIKNVRKEMSDSMLTKEY